MLCILYPDAGVCFCWQWCVSFFFGLYGAVSVPAGLGLGWGWAGRTRLVPWQFEDSAPADKLMVILPDTHAYACVYVPAHVCMCVYMISVWARVCTCNICAFPRPRSWQCVWKFCIILDGAAVNFCGGDGERPWAAELLVNVSVDLDLWVHTVQLLQLQCNVFILLDDIVFDQMPRQQGEDARQRLRVIIIIIITRSDLSCLIYLT